MTFADRLTRSLKKIVGKKAQVLGPSNCIGITLKSGKKHWGTVKLVEKDHFIMEISCAGGGEQTTVIKTDEVASFND